MRCLMAENQRRAILAELGPNDSLTEWGSGGSSVWFAENMTQGQSLYSIEHDRQWFQRMVEVRVARQLWHWHPVYFRVNHEGKNATPAEECPAGAFHYITKIPVAGVVLVDGIARGACLATLAAMRFPGVVFLHDANRDWYEWATSLFSKRQIIKATTGDYPPDLLRLEL